MKVKVKEANIEQVLAIKPKKKRVKKPNIIFRTLLKIISLPSLMSVKFKCERVGMERLGKKEQCLILMNHSSFIDLEILSSIFYPRPINIVTTFDAFIGKDWLMRQIGCLETKKFTTGAGLLRDMSYALNKLKTSILIFPEAGYSLDGRATVLPDSLGKCLKFFKVPVVTVITDGAFARQPLYNNLRKRKVPVTAKMEYLFSPEDIKEKSVEQLNAIIREKFSFDNFKNQKENGLIIADENRAEGLHRVLYKCPNCLTEGETVGAGTRVTCKHCQKEYELTELGEIQAVGADTEFSSVSEWVDWERDCVKREIEGGRYAFNEPVDIRVMVDTKTIYSVGEGALKHDENGFVLTGCGGKLEYKQSATAIYTINADFYWYQIADTINIGDLNVQYFCFPKSDKVSVFKARLATEELYKLKRQNP
ncbi:MAG: 1-acyl-sn-glycerol-3-phosphate acyltransferase [Clostridia bacterium]|nr:1-acyl-sn-glycerol-3-phosphate acyltransferase [Clostridia bacterium]